MQIITIPVPVELLVDPDCDFDLVGYLQDFIGTDLAPALDEDVWELDDRAQWIETEITHVENQGASVFVTYSVTFDAYYGCRDQNYAGTDERHLTGTRSDDHWAFPLYTRRERRSTVDEL